ncbi:hypothetical protein NIES4074_29980 [Cylindrospermum sp. NIES-4074]|nr:hypothetical protein NIES4074_29980 [Cylindrospermum sp. NIES-4074]
MKPCDELRQLLSLQKPSLYENYQITEIVIVKFLC